MKHRDIVLDLLTIPSDISFATKASGDNTDDNSLVTTDTNSFIASKSRQSSRRPRRSLASKTTVNEVYIMQLERKIYLKYKLQMDNN